MSSRRLLRPLALGAFLVAVTSSAAAAQRASVTGRVTDATSGQPVAAAQVTIIGTNLGTQTNSEGVYTIREIAPGAATVRVLRVGYAEATQQATFTAGQAATVNFTMRPVPISLTPVVTTATGEQRRVEVGNAIAQVNANEIVSTSAVSNVADLLTARTSGVQVLPGTQTGAGTRVRIRGTSSLSLNNDPIYVIDGIRVVSDNGSSTIGVGGTTPSRTGDLNPEEIESIEIVRGPSAAALYGTDAANGVIVITTKRGVAGRPQWTYYTEQTAIRDENDYPTAYSGWRSGPTAGTTSTPTNIVSVQCFLFQVASGACAQDSVTSYNLHKDKDATPYGTGYRQQHGLQLRGGTETVRYFLHGEWEDEDGVTHVPEFERRFLAENGLSLRSDQESPNRLRRATARANLNITLPGNADIAVNAGYTSQDLRLPRSDDSFTAGIAGNVYGGPGYKFNLNEQGDTLYGWRQFTPRQVYQQVNTQSIERFITSMAANWSPIDWLQLRGTTGLDFIQRHDTQICRFGECTPNNNENLGLKRDNHTNFYRYTADGIASATRTLTPTLESKTTVGVQFTRDLFQGNRASGFELPPGATTVSAGAVIEASETTNESRTFGSFLEQGLAWRERVFVTGAVRSDRNSAFGADFETVFYPKFDVSWIVSEEDFFPALGWMDQLRLRAALGASGVQPGTIDAVQYFSPSTVLNEAGEATGLVFSTLGNRNLKPERSNEFEIGVDGTFWQNRITTELTYYNKKSSDALISRVLPPSLGTGATARFENLGEVSNSGIEALFNAQLIQRDRFGWDMTLNASTNTNELVSLGLGADVPEIVLSSTQRHVEGYPLFGWWTYTLDGFEDRDGDGIIEYNADDALSEITVSSTPQFMGRSLPKYEIALSNGVEFWDRRLRLSAMLDYKGGHKVYNNTERIRCASRNNCSGLVNPESSLLEQARTVLVRQHPTRSVGGFIEDGDFVRFRELALTFSAPEDWAGRLFRGRNFTASLAARNLGVVWTKYTGVDPEAFGTAGNAPSEFQAFAPPTYYTLRLNFGF